MYFTFGHAIVIFDDTTLSFASLQDTRPTGTIPLAGNNVVRHQDDSRQMHSCKFEIVGKSQPI